MNNQTKTAIVTGSSRGMGAAIATKLAADGLAIVVNYAGNEESATNGCDNLSILSFISSLNNP